MPAARCRQARGIRADVCGKFAEATMVRARAGWFADGNARRHSRFAIDRGPAAAEPGTGGVRADDVDLAAGKNSGALASLASGDRSGLAATGTRARVRSARHYRPGTEAVCREQCD